MRYWRIMVVSLLGGILLINGGLKELMSVEARVFFVLGILSLGAARRMVQQKLHS
jgi:hypothetical protein